MNVQSGNAARRELVPTPCLRLLRKRRRKPSRATKVEGRQPCRWSGEHRIMASKSGGRIGGAAPSQIARGVAPGAAWRKEMTEKIYDIPPQWKTRALIDEAKYQEMYARSVEDPDAFWADAARRLDWYKAPTRIKNASFGPGDVSIKWFEDGVLNAAYNCID